MSRKSTKNKPNNNKAIIKKTPRIREPVVIEEVKFDEDKYSIIETTYPFKIKIWAGYRLYTGDLGTCIKEYEENYGSINDTIYYDKEKQKVAIIIDSGSHLQKDITSDIGSWKNNEL